MAKRDQFVRAFRRLNQPRLCATSSTSPFGSVRSRNAATSCGAQLTSPSATAVRAAPAYAPRPPSARARPRRMREFSHATDTLHARRVQHRETVHRMKSIEAASPVNVSRTPRTPALYDRFAVLHIHTRRPERITSIPAMRNPARSARSIPPTPAPRPPALERHPHHAMQHRQVRERIPRQHETPPAARASAKGERLPGRRFNFSKANLETEPLQRSPSKIVSSHAGAAGDQRDVAPESSASRSRSVSRSASSPHAPDASKIAPCVSTNARTSAAVGIPNM